MFRSVLLPVDLSDKHSWRKPLPVAVGLCESFEAQLNLLVVVPDFAPPLVNQHLPEGESARLREQAARQLKEFSAEQVPATLRCRRIVAEGKVYQEILRAAEVVRADLILMAAHRPEQKPYLLGPNAEQVTRHARCSVLIVRE